MLFQYFEKYTVLPFLNNDKKLDIPFPEERYSVVTSLPITLRFTPQTPQTPSDGHQVKNEILQ